MLAIGLVVDDAIVVVEAVEHHIEKGLAPKDAALKAMSEVSGPVVAIGLILAAVFVPTIFIPGITGRLYQQFAITIALSVMISAFNALTLSPALSALLLKPKTAEHRDIVDKLCGPIFRGFNRGFSALTNGYLTLCHLLIRRLMIFAVIIVLAVVAIWGLNQRLAPGFVNNEDQGFAFGVITLPPASSLQRTDNTCKIVEKLIRETPGVESCSTVVGYNMISAVQNTYSGFFFVTLKPWDVRYTRANGRAENLKAVLGSINAKIAALPECEGFCFPPPPIPGIGTSGGATFDLQDRSGGTIEFLEDNMKKFVAAAMKRPEIGRVQTTFNSERPATLRQRRQGPHLEAGCRALLRLPDHPDLHGRRLRQLLQPLRPPMAGLRPGRGPVPRRKPATSAASMSATARAKRCRSARSPVSRMSLVRSSRSGSISTAPRRSTPMRAAITATRKS